MSRRAFTLTEILIVLGIIALIAAIAFPAFNNDGLFPRGGDPTDLNTDAWSTAAGGVYEFQVDELPPLTYVLQPYIKNRELWHCPADNGFDVSDMAGELEARPSSFEKFGMSYYYRTELTLKRKKELIGWDFAAPPVEHGPSEINVLADGHGSWHGQNEPQSAKRYNVLMADGHVANFNLNQFQDAWDLRLDLPTSTTP